MKKAAILVSALSLSALLLLQLVSTADDSERFSMKVTKLPPDWERNFPARLPSLDEEPLLPPDDYKPPTLEKALATLAKEKPARSWFLLRSIPWEGRTEEERAKTLDLLRSKSGDAAEQDSYGPLEIAAELSRATGATGGAAKELFGTLYRALPRRIAVSQEAVREFCKGAGAESRELLETMVKDTRDPVNAGEALAALARFRGTDILADLEPMLNGGTMQYAVMAPLAALAGAGQQPAADTFVQQHHAKMGARAFEHAILHGGPDLVKWASTRREQMSPQQRFEFTWKERGVTVEAFFTRLVAAKLAPRMPSKSDIEKADALWPGKHPEAARALALLMELGVVLSMDSEADELPPPYPAAFAQLSKLSKGEFLPRGLKQVSPQDDEEAPPVVTFAVAGQKFTLRPRELGDWFDVEMIIAAANRALELSGNEARFIAMDSGGQNVNLVFGIPGAWKQIATEFALPLGLGNPVETGKKYEKHVIDELKRREGR